MPGGLPWPWPPPWWAAAEDHGPAVTAQAPQRLPAPANFHQSCYLRSLLLLLPGCSNAAPARPATFLPPRVGGERASTTSSRRRERGEREEHLSDRGNVCTSKNAYWTKLSIRISWLCEDVRATTCTSKQHKKLRHLTFTNSLVQKSCNYLLKNTFILEILF